MYDAPLRFAKWMDEHRHPDKKYNFIYLYHSRSDKHSVALCKFVVADLVEACQALRNKASKGQVVCGFNLPYTAPSGKVKNLDFAIGTPPKGVSAVFEADQRIGRVTELTELQVSCEAKSTMTEHSKSKPRMYDELSSSHEIIHQGRPEAIATGIAVVNIASTFLSPLRQISDTPTVTKHKQPTAAAGMVTHLRGLKIRDSTRGVGFEAFCTIVLDCDNVTCARLWTGLPAPQPGDIDHYVTYIDRVAHFYTERFG